MAREFRSAERDGANTRCVQRRASVRSPRRPSAFTLVEMLLVLLIMSMVAGIAVPRYADFTVRQRLGAAVRRVTTDIGLAQRNARMTGVHQNVMFAADGRSYLLPDTADPDDPALEYYVPLANEPYSVMATSVDFAGTDKVVFDGYGAPDTGGTIVLQSGSYAQTLTLDAQTGRISTSGVVKVTPIKIVPLVIK